MQGGLRDRRYASRPAPQPDDTTHHRVEIKYRSGTSQADLILPAKMPPGHVNGTACLDLNLYQVSSATDNAQLRAEDANGKLLGEDDESRLNLNSMVIFTPQVTGTYRIVAKSFFTPDVKVDQRPTGNYLLVVRQ
jgi:hypothetical protein